MRHTIYTLAPVVLSLFVALSSAELRAQEPQADESPLAGIRSLSETVARRQGPTTVVDLDLDLTAMDRLDPNTRLLVTPLLRANDGAAEVELPSFVFAGRTRAIILERHDSPADLVRSKRAEQQYHYSAEVPFAPWMKDASLLLVTEATGCADCDLGRTTLPLTAHALAPLYQPSYRYSVLVPEGEKTKRREESLTARIHFVVAKTDLRPSLANNRAELKRIEDKLHELTTNRDLTVDALSLAGYASPEGSAELNKRLSQGRVESIAQYLVRSYPRFKGHYTSQAYGADWDGLRDAVAESDIAQRDRILEILSSTEPEGRTAALRAIDGGETYSMLLDTYYPPLRRTVLTFSFVVKGFDLEEAREVIREHPTYLSLAEINLVANSYPAGSEERYATWVTAAGAFPDALEPATNAAVMDLEAGRYDRAVSLLESHKGNTRLYTILGIAHALRGDLDEAQHYLTRAAEMGLPDAEYNLGELRHYIEDNF